MALTALFAALLIAATQMQQGGLVAAIGSYVYWIIRISIEGLLFLVTRQALEKYTPQATSTVTIAVGAILASHIPFVLSVTAIDIVLGYPELGIEDGNGDVLSRIAAFALELVYLFDNHLALCGLLSLPQLMMQRLGPGSRDPGSLAPNGEELDRERSSGTILSAISPPLEGQITWIEAQEHYVRIVTTEEVRMVLCRFSDVTREMPATTGMQVHRSHWVAYSAAVVGEKVGQNFRLTLQSGDTVPVSRSFRSAVRTNFRNAEAPLVRAE